MRSFRIPEIDINQYIYRMEMHTHTKFASKCGDILPEDVVEIYHARGYDAFVLTNHIRVDYTSEHLKAHADAYFRAKEAADTVGMRIFFGVELNFKDVYNDFLVYGVVPADLPALHDFVLEGYQSFLHSPIRKRCIVFTAHPYRNDRVGAECYVPEISDGVETFNLHPSVNSDNGFMSRYASEKQYLTICGSDYHHNGHEAMAGLLVRQLPEDEAGLAALLRSGDYLFEFNENVVIPSHRMIHK